MSLADKIFTCFKGVEKFTLKEVYEKIIGKFDAFAHDAGIVQDRRKNFVFSGRCSEPTRSHPGGTYHHGTAQGPDFDLGFQ